MTGDAARARAFAPLAGPGTRILILGSLPGVESLRRGQYYGHPRNQFWRLVGGMLERDLQAMAYEARIASLSEVGIGLWDVVASAVRQGSLDAAMREVEAADLGSLVAGLPELRLVAFNGATAARAGRRQLAATGLTLMDLPSSSPAFAAMPLGAKLERWRAVGRWLGP